MHYKIKYWSKLLLKYLHLSNGLFFFEWCSLITATVCAYKFVCTHVEAIKLHLSKTNNPLLIFTFLQPFLHCILIFFYNMIEVSTKKGRKTASMHVVFRSFFGGYNKEVSHSMSYKRRIMSNFCRRRDTYDVTIQIFGWCKNHLNFKPIRTSVTPSL